jgi:hypothetical protein
MVLEWVASWTISIERMIVCQVEWALRRRVSLGRTFAPQNSGAEALVSPLSMVLEWVAASWTLSIEMMILCQVEWELLLRKVPLRRILASHESHAEALVSPLSNFSLQLS